MAQKKYQKKLLAKSLVDDSWTLQDVLRMTEGGNHKLIQHMTKNLNDAKGITFDESGLFSKCIALDISSGLIPKDIDENERDADNVSPKVFDAKYDTKSAGTYRKMISQRVAQVLGMHGDLKM